VCCGCVYSLVTVVSKWLPKWDFTSLHWYHLPEGIRIPFRQYDPSVPFFLVSLSFLSSLSLFPRATSFESPDSILPPKRHADVKRLLRPENGFPLPTSRRAAFRVSGPCSADPIPGAEVRYPYITNGAVKIVRQWARALADDGPARAQPARRP
jgi:hypothetical protein